MIAWPTPQPPYAPVARVGVATHDGRFFAPLRPALEEAGCVVRDDPWQGHRVHHEPLSDEIAEWADVMFAEWCLGNAVWHAANRRARRRLIVRFHRFELESDFPHELDIEAVDAVVFVGPHVRAEAIERFGWPEERCLFIPNSVDTGAFDLPKTDDARFTLGLLTWHRQLKRLDLALDLLEAVRADEPRFRLRVKGRRPEDVEHVWKYESERSYFIEQYERISRSPLLGDAVIFDPPGDDVAMWFAGVGHVLSLSDVESFHLALAEGMASGAVPIILDRPGTRALFGDEFIVADAADAVCALSARAEPDAWRAAGEAAQTQIVARFDRSQVLPAWVQLLTQGVAGREIVHG